MTNSVYNPRMDRIRRIGVKMRATHVAVIVCAVLVALSLLVEFARWFSSP
jgi:cytochrome b subunit of formate dehydrogenase